MPTARKLPSGSWRCQVFSHYEEQQQPDGTIRKKRIYKSFTCTNPDRYGKKEAEAMAAAWAAANRKSVSSDIRHLTYGEALDRYIAARSAVLSPATIKEYKRSRNADMQGLMSKRLYAITQEDVQREINHEALSHSPKTVKNMHGLISAVMNTYRPDFVLKTDLPKKIRPQLYIPTDAEIQRLMAYVQNTDMEIPIMLAAFGPMRRGEIAALDSAHINGNTVHVEYSMAIDETGNWIRKAPKSISGNRYICFPDFVIEKLRTIKGSITPLTPGQISDRFLTIRNRVGLRQLRFHDLRHYSASIQHALGVPDAYIMERGGWKNDAVLKNIYRHTLRDKNDQMNRLVNAHFENLCTTERGTD